MRTGEVELDGQAATLGIDQSTSMAAGIGLVPEDRKRQGLVLDLPIRANVESGHSRSLAGGYWAFFQAPEGRRSYRRLLWQAAGQGLLDGSPRRVP